MAVLTVPITEWEKGTEYKVTVPCYVEYPDPLPGDATFIFLAMGGSGIGENFQVLWTQEEIDAWTEENYPVYGIPYPSNLIDGDFADGSWTTTTDDIIIRLQESDWDALQAALGPNGDLDFSLDLYLTVPESSSIPLGTKKFLALLRLETYIELPEF